MSDKKATDTLQLAVEGIQERKGKNISIIDLKNIPVAAAPAFVIAEGTSTMHVTSIADSVQDWLLEKAGRKPYNYDGYRQGEWIVLDYGDVMVHVFMPEAREKYNLEELWSDAEITRVPDLD